MNLCVVHLLEHSDDLSYVTVFNSHKEQLVLHLVLHRLLLLLQHQQLMRLQNRIKLLRITLFSTFGWWHINCSLRHLDLGLKSLRLRTHSFLVLLVLQSFAKALLSHLLEVFSF